MDDIPPHIPPTVEGAERLVLGGATEVFAKCRPRLVFMEVSHLEKFLSTEAVNVSFKFV